MEIRTERLLLREFVDDDWPAVLAYQNHPDYLRVYDIGPQSEEVIRDFVHGFVTWQVEKPRYRFQLAVTLAASGELIGNFGIRKPKSHSSEAEIGYELSPWHWGNGYATEAGRAMLDFARDTLHLKRLVADCFDENVASAHVLEKLGMQLVHIKRAAIFHNSGIWDVRYYAMDL